MNLTTTRERMEHVLLAMEARFNRLNRLAEGAAGAGQKDTAHSFLSDAGECYAVIIQLRALLARDDT